MAPGQKRKVKQTVLPLINFYKAEAPLSKESTGSRCCGWQKQRGLINASSSDIESVKVNILHRSTRRTEIISKI